MHARHFLAAVVRQFISLGIRPHSSCNAGQAVANCCNAEVCCAPNDLSIPNVLNRQHIGEFGSKFPPMGWESGTPLDVKFDQRNVGRSSYLNDH